jgi:hypothetical protein
MKTKIIICLLICLGGLANVRLFAQTAVTISEGSNYVVPCSTMCFQLHATHTQPAHTDIYTVNPIGYTPSILVAPAVIN